MAHPPRTLITGMSLAVTWLSGNAWRREDSEVERLYDADYYLSLAQLAEQATFDFVFRPDSLFIDPSTLSSSVGFSGLDPTLLLTAVAMGTRQIGLLTTASTTFHSPYVIARQLQSLHHLSRGRAGWNVVTALDGHANFGLDKMPDTATRYARADEFTQAVKALWHSFPAQALRHDKAQGIYADVDKIKPIHFHGQHIHCEGPLSLAGHPAGDVPLFQAGASSTGKAFAAKIAQGIFAATPTQGDAQALREELQEKARELGRDPADIRVLPGLSLFLAKTDAQAKALFAHTRTHDQTQRHRMLIASSLGLQVEELPPHGPIDGKILRPMKAVRSRTHSELIRQLVQRESLTLDQLLERPEVAGSGHWLIVGTPETAAKEISQWYESGAIDGFIALPGGSRECFELVCRQLMPLLKTKGLVKSAYTGSTFKEHLDASLG